MAKILFVEDDTEISEIETELLTLVGYSVHPVRTAQDAIGYLLNSNDIDLVFTDVRLHNSESGLWLAEQIRQRYPKLPIVIATGYASRVKDVPNYLELIHKPYSIDAVQKVFSRLLPKVVNERDSEIRPVSVLQPKESGSGEECHSDC